jgi:hypothetical protein
MGSPVSVVVSALTLETVRPRVGWFVGTPPSTVNALDDYGGTARLR